MRDLEIQVGDVGEDDWRRWSTVMATAFGEQWVDADHAIFTEILRGETAIGAWVGDDIVATAGMINTDLTVPGGHSVEVQVVNSISTLPTHKRLGIASALQRELLDRARATEVTLMALESSEATIYQRFGFGPAARHYSTVIQTAHADFWHDVEYAGSFDFAEAEAIPKFAGPIWDSYRRNEPGLLARPLSWWAMVVFDAPNLRYGNGGKLQAVFHLNDEGTPDGYALYRVQEQWDQWLPNHQVEVMEVISADPDVETQLKRWLLDLDLAAFVKFDGIRQEEPLRWQLRDPRRLRTLDDRDSLWVKVIDVPMALSMRSYMADGEATFRLHDPFDDVADGSYRLAISGGTGKCERIDDADDCDFELSASQLGSLYLGGHSMTAMAMAGEVVVRDPRAAAAMDLAFRSQVAPRHLGFW